MTIRIGFQRVTLREEGWLGAVEYSADGGVDVIIEGLSDEFTANALAQLEFKAGTLTPYSDEVVYTVGCEVTERIDDPMENDDMADATYRYSYNFIKGLRLKEWVQCGTVMPLPKA
tara:strand:- start:986 stop:1333 length:348 start_codon:yes stop_codon:yes gene_type:complete